MFVTMQALQALFGAPEALTSTTPYSIAAYLKLTLASFIGCVLLRVVLDVFVFQPIGRKVMLEKREQKMQKLPDKLHSTVSKFTESLWKLSVYMSLWTFALYALVDKQWLYETKHYWEGLPNQLQSKRVYQLLFVQTGFYLSSIVMLQFWETRRKDFPVMMGHHFTTLALLVCAYSLGYDRVGSVILLLHDFSDILLELAKLFNYAKWENASMVMFVGMAASWFYLRLVLFPRNVVYSTLYEHEEVLGYPMAFHWPINLLLCTLVVMHVYWFYLIIKVAIKALQGMQRDVREDDD